MIDLGNDLTLEKATDADLEYVHEHLRPGDMVEHTFDTAKADRVKNLPGVMVIKYGETIIGYIGHMPPPMETVFSKARVVYYLSTVHADNWKLTYVKRTPEVLRAVVGTMPGWVEDILTVSMPEAYPMACKWLEKVLGFKQLVDFKWRGGVHRLYRKERKEV